MTSWNFRQNLPLLWQPVTCQASGSQYASRTVSKIYCHWPNMRLLDSQSSVKSSVLLWHNKSQMLNHIARLSRQPKIVTIFMAVQTSLCFYKSITLQHTPNAYIDQRNLGNKAWNWDYWGRELNSYVYLKMTASKQKPLLLSHEVLLPRFCYQHADFRII